MLHRPTSATRPVKSKSSFGGGFYGSPRKGKDEPQFQLVGSNGGRAMTKEASSRRGMSDDDAGNASSLSSTKGNTSHRAIDRAGASSAPVEREYIHNLQQQVYFLELELRAMKEQQEQQQRSGPIALRDQLQAENEGLKQKAQAMELENTKKAKEILEDEVSKLNNEIKLLESDKQSLLAHITRLEEKSTADKEKLIGGLSNAAKENRGLQLQLDKALVTNERAVAERDAAAGKLAAMQAQLAETESLYALTKSRLSDTEKSRDLSVRELAEEKKHWHEVEVEMIKLKENFSLEDERELKGRILKLQNKLKQSELQEQREREIHKILEEQLRALREEVVSANSRAEIAELNLEREQSRLAQIDCRTENESMKNKMVLLEKENSALMIRDREIVSQIAALKSEVGANVQALIALQCELDTKTRAYGLETEHFTKIDEHNRELQQDILLLKQLSKTHNRTSEEREKVIRDLQASLAHTQARLTKCERQLEMFSDISSLDLGSLSQLTNSNLHVANTLQRLVKSFNEDRSDTLSVTNVPRSDSTRTDERSARAEIHPQRPPSPIVESPRQKPPSPISQNQSEIGNVIAARAAELWEAFDYLDERKQGSLSVDLILSELEGIDITATPLELGLPGDLDAKVNWRTFLKQWAKR